jgi:hypothetical protein
MPWLPKTQTPRGEEAMKNKSSEPHTFERVCNVPVGTTVTILGRQVPIKQQLWKGAFGAVVIAGIFRGYVSANQGSPTQCPWAEWSLRLIDRGREDGALIALGKAGTLTEAIQRLNARAAEVVRDMLALVPRSDDVRAPLEAADR